MARIGASLSGIERRLLNQLAESNAAATLSSLRMAAGQRVLAPRDDVSAFVTLSGYQSKLSNVTATMTNATAANSLISRTQTLVGEIRTQLELIETALLTDEDQGLSESERTAAQAGIDAAIEEINALASTSIDGRRMLDGSAAYAMQGRNSSQVSRLTVYSDRIGGSTISGEVIDAATQAELTYTGASSAVDTGDGGTLTVTGAVGSADISINDSQLLSDVATEINNQSHNTGVIAEASGDTLTFSSVEYGSDATLEISSDAGFSVTGGNGDGTAQGADMTVQLGAIEYAAGDASHVSIRGNQLTFSRNGLHYKIEFAEGFSGDFDTITIGDGAPDFALSTDVSRRTSVSIPSLATSQLGGISGRLTDLLSGGSAADLDDNTSEALRIVGEALGQLDVAEGIVDGVYNSSVTTANDLLAELEADLEDAITAADGYDENEEAVLQAKNEALASNAVTGLALMTQQRSAIIELIRQAAGLD